MKKILGKAGGFASWMAGLKNNKKTLRALICLDVFLAVGSLIADWPWLAMIKWYLLPLAPICSIYPLSLAIWFSLYYFGKKIPTWYTTFIFVGIVSYGIMAYIYYPAFISWVGPEFRLIGNMFWVTAYALQSFIIFSELKKMPFAHYLCIAAYFGFKDYADRYLGSFVDILRSDFPEPLKNVLFISIVALHIGVFTVAFALPNFRAKRCVQSFASEKCR
jgi:hypothetical protein